MYIYNHLLYVSDITKRGKKILDFFFKGSHKIFIFFKHLKSIMIIYVVLEKLDK